MQEALVREALAGIRRTNQWWWKLAKYVWTLVYVVPCSLCCASCDGEGNRDGAESNFIFLRFVEKKEVPRPL